MKYLLPLLYGAFVWGCQPLPQEQTSQKVNPSNYYLEKGRPQIHFTPESKPLERLDGLIYFQGEYHLYYSADSLGTSGHATSKDLVYWTHQQVEIPQNMQLRYVFNSAVGTTGYPPEVYLAFAQANNTAQAQLALLISRDNGYSWELLENELVFDLPAPATSWPRISWVDQRWVMSLAVENQVRLFESDDLVVWSSLSQFGVGQGNHESDWKSAELQYIPETGGNGVWAMLVEMSEMTSSGSQMQYFLGSFNGYEFTNGHLAEIELMLGKGQGNQGVICAGLQGARTVYVELLKVEDRTGQKWKNLLSHPRELSVFTAQANKKIQSFPLNETWLMRRNSQNLTRRVVSGYMDLSQLLTGENKGIDIELIVTKTQRVNSWQIKWYNSQGEATYLGYNSIDNHYYSYSTAIRDSMVVEGKMLLEKRTNYQEQIASRIVFDESSVEMYGDMGQVVFSITIDPFYPYTNLHFVAPDGAVVIEGMLYDLERIW